MIKEQQRNEEAKGKDNFLQKNVSLADKNWFGTGGNARYFAAPQTASELMDAMQTASDNNLSVFILGSGANILIADDGFDGLVIQPKLQHISHRAINQQTVHVTAEAGCSVDALIDYCLDHELIGLEEFSGIPGTVGGAVYINLHYFEFLLSQFLSHATIFDKSLATQVQVDNEWFNFGYNRSRLHDKNYILLDATFALKSAPENTIAYARGRRAEIIRHRSNRAPQTKTCGSFFRNFHPHEIDLTLDEKKIIWVAHYLETVGVKGALQKGDAIVSYQHANMIINKGSATSADIIWVARAMQERVYDRFGILLQPECQLIGFTAYPLLQK